MLPTLFFKSILAIFYGSLWIHYLHKLTDPDSTPRRCREVAPVLRSVLTVIAWVGVVLGVLVVGMLLAMLCVRPTAFVFVMALIYVILVFIYVYQIQFLKAIEVSDEWTETSSGTNQDGCDAVEQKKRRLSMVFAVFVLVFGIVLGVIGFTWGDGLTQWLTEQLRSGLSGRNTIVVRPGKNGPALLMRRMMGGRGRGRR